APAHAHAAAPTSGWPTGTAGAAWTTRASRFRGWWRSGLSENHRRKDNSVRRRPRGPPWRLAAREPRCPSDLAGLGVQAEQIVVRPETVEHPFLERRGIKLNRFVGIIP